MLNLVFIITIAYDTWTDLQTIKYIDELNMLFTKFLNRQTHCHGLIILGTRS